MEHKEIEVECRGRIGLITILLQPFVPFQASKAYYNCFLESIPADFDSLPIEKAVQRECDATIGSGRWLYFPHRPGLEAPQVSMCEATTVVGRAFIKAVSRTETDRKVLSDKLVDFVQKFFTVLIDGLSLLGQGSDKIDQKLAAELHEYWQSKQQDNGFERLAAILSRATSNERVDWHTDMNYRYLEYVSCKSKKRTMLKKLKFCRLLSDITNGLIPTWGQACACLVYNAIKAKRYRASDYYKMSDQENVLATKILVEMLKAHEFEVNISKDAWLEHPIWFHSFIRKIRASTVCVELGIGDLTSLDIQADIDKFDLARFGIDIGLSFSTVLAREMIHGMGVEIKTFADQVSVHFGRRFSHGSADIPRGQYPWPGLQTQTTNPIDTCEEFPSVGSVLGTAHSLHNSSTTARGRIVPATSNDSAPMSTALLAEEDHLVQPLMSSYAVPSWPIPPIASPRYFSIRPTAIVETSAFEPWES